MHYTTFSFSLYIPKELNRVKLELKELASFLVKAKRATYAGGGKDVKPQRPGFKELEFSEGDFNYRDSYAGFYAAPGQEIVRFKGVPVWSMAYDGETMKQFRNETAFKIYAFLKKALMQVEETEPFRGLEYFEEGNFVYISETVGDITRFTGQEKILLKGIEAFRQSFFGGLILHLEK
jgi:hypothetical protein